VEENKPWHFNRLIKPTFKEKDGKYVYIPAGEEELKRVITYYKVCPVPGYDIGRVDVVYNPKMLNLFESYLEGLQEKKGNPAFMPDWEKEDTDAGKSSREIKWRAKISASFEEITVPYKVMAYSAVKLLPVWHGTDPAILDSIFRTGYANLSKMDDGFFGKGFYFTQHPAYANRVYSKGALLLNWVGCFAAYPVMDGDMPKLRAKNNYKQYDAHFVPVVPASNSPNEISYYPTKPGEQYVYNELALFQSAGCLPWGIIHLQATLLKSPSEKSSGEAHDNQKNSINAPVDKNGNTLLHLAIKDKKSLDYLKTLMEQGADYKIRNKKGERPVDTAPEKTKLFLETQHKTLKKMAGQKLEFRITRLEQKISVLESETLLKLQIEDKATNNTNIGNRNFGM